MDGKALVVLSGGQDSTTCLFWAKETFKEVHAVSFNYGQRHSIELISAAKVAGMAGVASFEVIKLDGLLHSTSPLTSDTELERYTDAKQMEEIIGNRIEKTFVPMRNTMFMVVAMNRAVELGCRHLVTGICQEDNANYPDCTAAFRNKFEELVNESLGLPHTDPRAFMVHAPLMLMSKAETCHFASRMPGCLEALAYSHTSYDGKYPPIDMNHANVLRAAGFELAGLPDPLVVRAFREGLMPLPRSVNYDSLR